MTGIEESIGIYVQPCMGGWCAIRDSCAAYKEPKTRNEPAERLCRKKRDGEYFKNISVRVVRVVNE